MISSLSEFLCHLAGTWLGQGQARVSAGARGGAKCVHQVLTDWRRLGSAQKYKRSQLVVYKEAKSQSLGNWVLLLCSVIWWLCDCVLVT